VSHGARATAGVGYAAATSREKSKISPTPQAEGAARIKGARSQREDAKLVKVEFQLHRLVIGEPSGQSGSGGSGRLRLATRLPVG
jgi:hypothetical protein